MIFVTTGTERYPFNRLLQCMAAAAENGLITVPIFVQSGCSNYVSRFLEQRPFLPFSEMLFRMQEADVVIGHAGVGTLMMALRARRRPLLFPRQRRLGEHVNDHQTELARRLEENGRACIAWTAAGLVPMVQEMIAHPVSTYLTAGADSFRQPLVDFLRHKIVSLPHGEANGDFYR